MSTFVRGIGSEAKGFCVGSTEVNRMYLGTDLIYKKLPYDAEVAYLQSTGVEHIDTNIIPDSNYKIECKFLFTNTSNFPCVFGSGTGPTVQNIELYASGSGTQFEFHYYGYAEMGTCAANKTYKIIQDKGDVTVYNANESVNVAYSFGSKTFTCPYTMYLFALHRETVYYGDPAARIMYFKMWNGNGTLVCDMIPVRVGTVGYMYDRVTEQMFGNGSGSGAFVLGSDV